MKKLWNEACRMVERFRKSDGSAQNFRTAVTGIFGELGWSAENDEIIPEKEIPIGATKSVHPDLVISSDGANRYVVELKRPAEHITNRDAEQLFSYMRLLQLDFGLLMGESLQFFYDDPSDTKQPVLIADVPFIEDDEEGIEIFKLFSKKGFDVFGLTHYCEAVMTERKRQGRIRGIANTLCSLKGKRFIRDVVRAQLQKQYPADIVRDVMRRIDIAATMRDPSDIVEAPDDVQEQAAQVDAPQSDAPQASSSEQVSEVVAEGAQDNATAQSMPFQRPFQMPPYMSGLNSAANPVTNSEPNFGPNPMTNLGPNPVANPITNYGPNPEANAMAYPALNSEPNPASFTSTQMNPLQVQNGSAQMPNPQIGSSNFQVAEAQVMHSNVNQAGNDGADDPTVLKPQFQAAPFAMGGFMRQPVQGQAAPFQPFAQNAYGETESKEDTD